jgi:pimeloyl-ACP methyl ester carboxylesterase
MTGSSTDAQTPPSPAFAILPWKWGPRPAEEYNPVIIIPGILGSWEKNGDWVVDPILHTYDNLIDTFLANGYVEGKTLFRFGYDWEEPNEVTASILGNKIKEVKQTCGCQYVDLIGHSMGGLVALSYIERSDYGNDVDQLFLVATPIEGAPLAYKAWEAGEVAFGNSFQNAFMQTKFWFEARSNGYSSVFDYIRKKPIESIHELLPVYSDYLSTATTTLEYPTGYPTNGFLESLIPALSAKVFKKVDTKILLADTLANNTVSSYQVEPSMELPKWKDGKPTETYTDAGDGTVPRTSIENIVGSVDKEFDDMDHLQIASSSAPYIFEQMNKRTVKVVVGKTYNTPISYLYFKLFSPIDMQIVAPDGRRIGKDFSTNAELSASPDTFYSGFNAENEYAIILNPMPGAYKVETVGTGSGGNYTIVTDYFNGATTTEAEVSGSTAALQVIDHTLMLSAATSAIVLTKEAPAPSRSYTPDSCIADITKANKDRWIPKKTIYDGLVFDCKGLKPLFKTRDSIESTPANKRGVVQKLLLAATRLGINALLDHMDLLAKDKTNTKEGVELVHKYTTWFRSDELHR